MISILWIAFYTLIYLSIGYGIFALLFRTWQREPNVPHEDVAPVAKESNVSPEFLYGLVRALVTTLWPVYLLSIPIIIIKSYRDVKRND